jgi:hypothetical protein
MRKVVLFLLSQIQGQEVRMKRQLLCVFLVVAGVLMLPNLSQPQSTPAAGDAFVVAALVCGGPAPILGQLTSLTVNGVPTSGGFFSCSDTSRVTSFEPVPTDLTPTCGTSASGVPIPEDAVCSVSATVSVGPGPNPPTPPVTCTGSQSSLPLMITCDDTVNHLHLHLIVR